jgi:O-antigen/teichoic acid export membrane protein
MAVLCGCIFWVSGNLLQVLFDFQLAEDINAVLPLLIIGTALQSLSIVPFSLQLAVKWTGFAFKLNLICVSIVLFALPLLVGVYGIVGAAYTWVGYNAVSISVTGFVVVRRFPFLFSSLIISVRIILSMLVLCLAVFSLFEYQSLWTTSSIYLVGAQVLLSGLILLVGAYLYRNQLRDFN